MSVGPLRAVLDAFREGAVSVAEVRRRTGLGDDVVDAAIDHLIRLGELDASYLAMGCPEAGCGSCASGVSDPGDSTGTGVRPGCGAASPAAGRRGPVLVALTLPPRRDAQSGERSSR